MLVIKWRISFKNWHMQCLDLGKPYTDGGTALLEIRIKSKTRNGLLLGDSWVNQLAAVWTVDKGFISS